MTYLDKFTAYAPELGAAIRRMDSEFVRELETTETNLAAFDVREAFTVYWWEWHGGQSSRLYSLGSRFNHEFDFEPSQMLGGRESLEDNAQELLSYIQEEFQRTETNDRASKGYIKHPLS